MEEQDKTLLFGVPELGRLAVFLGAGLPHFLSLSVFLCVFFFLLPVIEKL
jgi:hypothetical protein